MTHRDRIIRRRSLTLPAMQRTRTLPPTSPAPERVSQPRWSYRLGFGCSPIAVSTPKRARPRLGEIIVAQGQRWRVYDWIKTTAETTLFVEALSGVSSDAATQSRKAVAAHEGGPFDGAQRVS